MTTEQFGDGGKAIIEFATARTEPRIETFKDPLGIGPDVIAIIGHNAGGGTEISEIDFDRDTWRDRPRRRRGTISVTTLESFIALVNRQSIPPKAGVGPLHPESERQSVIFVDDSAKPSLTAVLNFHAPGDGEPEFCDDRIKYEFPLSQEWKDWTQANGAKLDQGQFAEWLENHLFDIGDIGCAGAITTAFCKEGGVQLAGRQTILGLSKGLAIRVEHRVARTINLQSGEGRIEFNEEHQAEGGGPLTVPAAFHLFIPVFQGGPRYSIPVRLRYRTGGGRISWFFEIHRADLFLKDAVDEAIAIVRRSRDHKDGDVPAPGCGLSVFMGVAP